MVPTVKHLAEEVHSQLEDPSGGQERGLGCGQPTGTLEQRSSFPKHKKL